MHSKSKILLPCMSITTGKKVGKLLPHTLPSRTKYLVGMWHLKCHQHCFFVSISSTKWGLQDNWQNRGERKVFIHARAELSPCKTGRQVKQHEESKYRLISKPPCGWLTSWTLADRKKQHFEKLMFLNREKTEEMPQRVWLYNQNRVISLSQS